VRNHWIDRTFTTYLTLSPENQPLATATSPKDFANGEFVLLPCLEPLLYSFFRRLMLLRSLTLRFTNRTSIEKWHGLQLTGALSPDLA
jgi:hypothetical protein